MGTDGFEFVEYAHPKPEELHALFKLMGFVPVARHRTKKITVYRQGDINYLVNEAPGTHGFAFVADARARVRRRWHSAWSMRSGPMSARCRSARNLPIFRRRRRRSMSPRSRASAAACCISSIATARRARPTTPSSTGSAQRIRGRKGPGCFIWITSPTTSIAAAWTSGPASMKGCSISGEIRFFDIEGRASGLFSRALTSPDGKIRIPINEDAGDSGQIEEYLNVYRGEGIQHIACGSNDIYRTVETLRADGLPFMPPPPETYFEKIDARLPKHGEDVARLQRDGILIDGEGVVDGGHTKVLLQIFSANAIGPIFFEFIQRKGDDGFGEGNFKALFESIEEDQIRRGVLTLKGAA